MKRTRARDADPSRATSRISRARRVAAGGATPENTAPVRGAGRGERALLACVSLLGACVAGWIFFQVSAIRPLVEWDEGGYLWKAHLTVDALRHLRVGEAWRLAGADPLKPPLQSLLDALAFAAFGESLPVAFAVSAVALALAFPLVWRAARELCGRAGAWIALAFLLGSRLHLEFSATALLEVSGTTLTLLVIALDIRARRRGTAGAAWATGSVLAALFFYKYNYGLLLAVGLVGADLVEGIGRPLTRERRGTWLPLLIGASLWFLQPDKLQGFGEFARNRNTGLGVVAATLFYPRALLNQYAAWPPSGIALLAFSALAASVANRRTRPVMVFALVGLGAMLLHPYKLERSIATVVPALWLLAGVGGEVAFARLAVRPPVRSAAAAALALLLLAPLPWLYARDLPALRRAIETGVRPPWSRVAWPGRDLVAVEAAILDGVDPSYPVYTAGEFNELSPTVLTWQFAVRHPGTPVVTRCFGQAEPPRLPCNIVTLELMPGSHYWSEDYRLHNEWALEPIREFERRAPPPALARDFPAAGVRLRIHRLAGSAPGGVATPGPAGR